MKHNKKNILGRCVGLIILNSKLDGGRPPDQVYLPKWRLVGLKVNSRFIMHSSIISSLHVLNTNPKNRN